MVKKEWQKLSQNKMLLISSIVILFIPVLYAAFFLKSNWDPYGNTDKLPVAVVNLDQPVNYEGEELAIGDELVTNLKSNDALDWHFVSKEDAKKGLEDREYYMVMTLPKNLSEDASTLMDDKPRKMEIQYETNGSLNYISEVISGSAAKEVRAEVSANVTEAYAEAVFDQIGDIGEGFQEAADGASDLNDGAEELKDGNEEITKNLKVLAESTLTFSDGAEDLEMGLSQYTAGVSQVNDGAQQLNSGINTLSSNVGPLKEGVGQLNTGALSLNQGLQSYTSGVSALNQGLNQLTGSSAALKNGTQTLSTGIDQAKAGSNQLLAGLETLKDSLNETLNDEKQQKKLEALEEGLPKIQAGISELNNQITSQIEAGKTDIGQVSDQIDKDKIEQAAGSINQNMTAIKEDMDTTKSALEGSKGYLENIGASIPGNTEETIGALQQTDAYQSLTDEQKQELVNTLSSSLKKHAAEQSEDLQGLKGQVESAGSSLKDAGENVGSVVNTVGGLKEEIDGLVETLENMHLDEKLAGLTENLEKLESGVQELDKKSQVALPGAVEAITSLRGGLVQIQTALTQQGEGENKGVLQGVTELDQGLAQIQAGLSGENGLVSGINKYTTGVSQVQQGAFELNKNSSALTSGSLALSNGIGQMNDQLPALTGGINQLQEGSETLAQGTSELDANGNTLMDGSQQLSDGAAKIHEGSKQLTEGSSQVGVGMSALTAGTKELKDSLEDGADEVNKVDATDDTLSMFSDPAELEHKEYSHVPNYGAALAPYIMSMALYIGAVVFNTIYPVRKMSTRNGSAFGWWVSKLSIALPSAILMGVIETLIMLALGLPVDHAAQFIGLAVITSMAFTSIVLFLAMTLNNVGRFIAMLLLILQLGGSGGTFPMPLTNKFFMAIHPFLPMSYSIYGFRQAISDGLGQHIYVQAVLLMLILTVVFCGLLYLSMKWLFDKKPDDFLDEDEVAAEEA